MAITRQRAPDETVKLIRRALADLASGEADLLGTKHLAEMSQPVPLYTVPLDRFRGRDGTSALRQSGWRSVVQDEGGTTCVADVAADGENLRFARLVSGPRVDAMVRAGARAEQQFGDEDYELRIFESPSLKVGAVWLAGARSRFLPYAGLEEGVLDESAFFAALSERVLSRVSSSLSTEEPVSRDDEDDATVGAG